MGPDALLQMKGLLEGDLVKPRTFILKSWERCKQKGIEPHRQLQRKIVGDLRQRQEKKAEFIGAAKHYLSFLQGILWGERFIVALTDEEGIVLSLLGDTETLKVYGDSFAFPSADWSEDALGTNAVGTCLIEQKEVLLFPCDHYLNSLKRWVSIAIPIFSSDGSIIGTMALLKERDAFHFSNLGIVAITTEALEKELSTVYKYKFLASSMAHEVKNALTTVKGYLQLSKSGREDLLHENMDFLLCELERGVEILSDFSFLNKPNTIGHQSICLPQLIGSVCQTVLADRSHISLEVCCGKDLSPLKGDAKQIRQLFINLIKNAVEAMPYGGSLLVRVVSLSSNLLISIEDTGLGMNREILKRCFLPFNTSKEGGTGLGMTVCKKIVENHRGKISVESREGRGTTVYVRFPVGNS